MSKKKKTNSWSNESDPEIEEYDDPLNPKSDPEIEEVGNVSDTKLDPTLKDIPHPSDQVGALDNMCGVVKVAKLPAYLRPTASSGIAVMFHQNQHLVIKRLLGSWVEVTSKKNPTDRGYVLSNNLKYGK